MSAVPDATYANQAVAGVLSVMRTVSTPYGLHTEGEPNNSSTLWRTVADQKNLVYFFDSATSPNAFWVEFADLDFKEGAPVKKLTMAGRQSLRRLRFPQSSSRQSHSSSCRRRPRPERLCHPGALPGWLFSVPVGAPPSAPGRAIRRRRRGTITVAGP
ncbi:MAG: linear amide C-N hydrolase [Hyphomicrobium sp.]